MNREFELAEPHAEWLHLCALATAGALEPAEQERLRLHLGSCAQCREMLSDYRTVVREGIPLIAEDFAPPQDELTDVPEWDANAARGRLFAALDEQSPRQSQNPATDKKPHRRRSAAVALWAGLAASLVISVGVSSYELGRRSVPPTKSLTSPLLAKVQSLASEKASLDKKLDGENTNLAELEKQTADHESEMAKLHAQLEDSETQLSTVTAARSASDQQLQSTMIERDNLAARLQAAQQAYQTVQTELTNLKTQRQQDLLHYASLDAEVTDLTRQLHEVQGHVNDDTQYLASDRDIRELMGARQLYIADVVDVDQNGDRRKPFGRVFYTKGKSLIFYAFDLDQQQGLRRAREAESASTYQAWAREGSDKAQPVSLGIFYVDSEANRRWALKTSDPKTLAQINSVFVTVEPKGGSQKPTGKPLLYAYLRTETPNHP